jgi:hypothetical protein
VDLNTNAHRIVTTLTERDSETAAKSEARRVAGKAGGAARARALTDAERKQIELAGSKARWPKKKDG